MFIIFAAERSPSPLQKAVFASGIVLTEDSAWILKRVDIEPSFFTF